MSNAIDLATLSTEDGNNDSKEDDACGTASASPQSGGTNKASNDIPMATPHNTTSISFSHLGSLSAKKKSSLSPMPPNLLPQLSTFSAGTQGMCCAKFLNPPHLDSVFVCSFLFLFFIFLPLFRYFPD